MIINLTKLLNVRKYTGVYGETSWTGMLSNDQTSETDTYAFEIEKEVTK